MSFEGAHAPWLLFLVSGGHKIFWQHSHYDKAFCNYQKYSREVYHTLNYQNAS